MIEKGCNHHENAHPLTGSEKEGLWWICDFHISEINSINQKWKPFSPFKKWIQVYVSCMVGPCIQGLLCLAIPHEVIGVINTLLAYT